MVKTPLKPLYLLPNFLGEEAFDPSLLPLKVHQTVASLQGLIAENKQVGRRYLSCFMPHEVARSIPIALYKGESDRRLLDFLLEPIEKEGKALGLVSDAGLPCIADPGFLLVRRAREKGIPVEAFGGLSSIFLALMLSGLPAQRFQFNGYLPIEELSRKKELLRLEAVSKRERMTEVFMEAPHRAEKTLELCFASLQPTTWFSVAWDLTLPTQGVLSGPLYRLKKQPIPSVKSRAALFLFFAEE